MPEQTIIPGMEAIAINNNTPYLVISDYSNEFYRVICEQGVPRLVRKSESILSKMSYLRTLDSSLYSRLLKSLPLIKRKHNLLLLDANKLITPTIYQRGKSKKQKAGSKSRSKIKARTSRYLKYDFDSAYGIGMTYKSHNLIYRGFR